MSDKYKIGEKYFVKVFTESEEMEYLGEVKTKRLNGSSVDIRFDVFRRYEFGRPDLIATYEGKFLTRSHKNTIEDLVESIGKMFQFEGSGHECVRVGDISLSIDEFLRQVDGLLTKQQADKCISNGRFYGFCSSKGEIKWCKKCQSIKQTTCGACGCGNCTSCGYRWNCYSIPTLDGLLIPSL